MITDLTRMAVQLLIQTMLLCSGVNLDGSLFGDQISICQMKYPPAFWTSYLQITYVYMRMVPLLCLQGIQRYNYINDENTTNKNDNKLNRSRGYGTNKQTETKTKTNRNKNHKTNFPLKKRKKEKLPGLSSGLPIAFMQVKK